MRYFTVGFVFDSHQCTHVLLSIPSVIMLGTCVYFCVVSLLLPFKLGVFPRFARGLKFLLLIFLIEVLVIYG